jgi:NAD(P)-dependent dehydrogenase (short-subunit alcohol dehydrogenase family)
MAIPGATLCPCGLHLLRIDKRLTVPEDVARCITAPCHPATYWMTGNTLHVDGGENVVG